MPALVWNMWEPKQHEKNPMPWARTFYPPSSPLLDFSEFGNYWEEDELFCGCVQLRFSLTLLIWKKIKILILICTKNCTFFTVPGIISCTCRGPINSCQFGQKTTFINEGNLLDLILLVKCVIKIFLLKDVPAKRPVLVNISLEGIKVCCPQGQVRRTLFDSFFSFVHFGLKLGLWPTLEKAFVVVL